VGQRSLLINVVREQILRARKAGAQWVLCAVASEDLIGCVQPKCPEQLRIERLVDVIAMATRHEEQIDCREDGHRISTCGRSG
jgi:hypothetical protein